MNAHSSHSNVLLYFVASTISTTTTTTMTTTEKKIYINILFSFMRGVLILSFVRIITLSVYFSCSCFFFSLLRFVSLEIPFRHRRHWCRDKQYNKISFSFDCEYFFMLLSVINKDDCLDDSQRDEFMVLHPCFLCAKFFNHSPDRKKEYIPTISNSIEKEKRKNNWK